MSEQSSQYLEAMGIQRWVRREPSPCTVSAAVRETGGPPATPEPGPAFLGGEDPRAAGVTTLGWDALQAQVQACTRCDLHRGRTHAVFEVGAHDAGWMVIGEGPGAEEDRRGEPFVGQAGKLLDNMLRALGLTREAVYIANIVKCRPPNNRDPRPEEAAACRPYLERQIELVRPRLILALGRVAAQNLLQSDLAVGKLRGRVHRYGLARIPLVVTYHPAYLLRSPEQKRRAWDDLALARAQVEEGA